MFIWAALKVQVKLIRGCESTKFWALKCFLLIVQCAEILLWSVHGGLHGRWKKMLVILFVIFRWFH